MRFTLLMVCISLLVGCDPIYPPGELRVATIDSIAIDETVELELLYPNSGGSIVTDWKDQTIEIVTGSDVVSVSGLSITGLKSGTATLLVRVTTVLTEESVEMGYLEKVYSVEMDIEVE